MFSYQPKINRGFPTHPLCNRYNGSLPNGDRGRRKSRFALYRRTKANGVKPSTVHIINTPQASKVPNTSTFGIDLIEQCADVNSNRNRTGVELERS